MDLQHEHPTTIHALRPCRATDARDLLAIAGEHAVEVLQISDSSVRLLATFHIGVRTTALAWSSNNVSPSSSDAWHIELVAAGADYGLHLLTKSSTAPEHDFAFGGGLSGHHGKVNDMAFCGGWDDDSARYVATVSDDQMLIVWDLFPTHLTPPLTTPTSSSSATALPHAPAHPTQFTPDLTLNLNLSPSPSSRPQPTAYPIPFPHALTAIRAHPTTSKEFLVADSHGSLFLTDWRSDPEDTEGGALRHGSVVELVEPVALAESCMGGRGRAGEGGVEAAQWSSSIDWRADAIDIVGGVFGTKFALWDISKLRGGLPLVSGSSFSSGVQIFRWCQTHPEYFALASHSPTKGAILHVHNCNYVQAAPTRITVRPKPHFIRDFDFLPLEGIPRVAAAVGNLVLVFAIGDDS